MLQRAEPSHLGQQAVTGLTLAVLVIAGWAVLHVGCALFYEWSAWSWFTAPLLAALISWLYVGLFIVAHDAMHGSLAPGRPALNRAFGRLCVGLYAGFDFDLLTRNHHRHHRRAGTGEDPDFDDRPPHRFWPWYTTFMVKYATVRQPLFFSAVFALYVFVLGADPLNVAAFVFIPALASSLQLFYFGTYLPHRPGRDTFTDEHRTRSLELGWWLSLLACFHFGYHHEHHLKPGAPWWRLPAVRRSLRAGSGLPA